MALRSRGWPSTLERNAFLTSMEFLKGQPKLLHGLYYQDRALTKLVAGVLRDGPLALAVEVEPDAKIERGQELS
jgi:hypothetical protein